jgi:DNA-binding CsgD family transcriptional regulator
MLLNEADVRAMVRLVAEVSELQRGYADKKRCLMEGLCQLVDADAWAWCLCVNMAAEGRNVYTSVLHGGMDDAQYAHMLEATAHRDEARFTEKFADEIRQVGQHVTRLRKHLDPGNLFLESEAYHLWKKAGFMPGILSCRPIDSSCLSTVGVFRRHGRPDLSEREARIAHIVLTEVPWIHLQGWPEDRAVTVPALPPRQRIVLNLLLEGQTRKQIADHLEISINTVAGYVRDVFKHFGVRSHAELMRRFLSGDGNDVPLA